MEEPTGRGHGGTQQDHLGIQGVEAVGGLAKESEERQMEAPALCPLAAGPGTGDATTDHCNELLPGLAKRSWREGS